MKKNIQKKNITTSDKALKKTKANPSIGFFEKYLPLIILLAVIFFAYLPCIDNDLTNWDDPTYLNENPLIRSLDAANIKRIFTENYFGNYQPLHILSYAIEYHFYGLNPKGYHVTSIIMFMVACALIYIFIYQLSNNKITATLTTALYGLNAMRVESVAWAAERKDLLYLLFFVASLIAYVQYIKGNNAYKYLALAFLLFAISIFSKVMAASILGPMIMLDYWYSRKFSWQLIAEKIPFVLTSIWVGLKQVAAVDETGTIDKSNIYSVTEKLLIACRNLIFYPIKLIAPVNLSAFYPYPPKGPGISLPTEFYLCGLAVMVLAVLLILSARKTKVIIFCGGFFVSTIILVLQYVPVGPTMFSERYSLVPGIAFAFLLAYGIVYLIETKPQLKQFIYGTVAAYLLFLFITTYKRCNVWQDSLTLWDDTIAQFPNVATALNNRGKYYGEHLQKLDEAMSDLTRSITADPNYELAYNNRGIVYSIRKQYDLAIADFDKAIALKATYMEAIHNRAIALASTKQFDRALGDFTKIINDNPNKAASYIARGYTYLQVNKPADALTDFNKAIALNGGDGNAFLNRSQAHFLLKNFKAAEVDIQTAQQLGAQVDANYLQQVKQANAQ